MAIETGDRLDFDLDKDESLRVSLIRGTRPSLRGLLSDYAEGRTTDGEWLRTALLNRAAEYAKYAAR